MLTSRWYRPRDEAPAAIADDAPGRRSGVLGLWFYEENAVARASELLLAHRGWETICIFPSHLHGKLARCASHCYAPYQTLYALLRMDRLRVIDDRIAPTDAEVFEDGNWCGETARAIEYAHRLGIDCAVIDPRTGAIDPRPWRQLRRTCIPERVALVLDECRKRFRQRCHLRLEFDADEPAPIKDDDTRRWLHWQELIAALPLDLVRRLARWNHEMDMASLAELYRGPDRERDIELESREADLHRELVNALGPLVTIERDAVDWSREPIYDSRPSR